MEKLLQLLNEYQNSYKSKFIFSDYDEKTTSFSLVNSEMCLGAETIISKKFGFIQWLVKENRIDHGAFAQIFIESKLFDNIADLTESECLIMYLSIQDDPISFLVSILK